MYKKVKMYKKRKVYLSDYIYEIIIVHGYYYMNSQQINSWS